jgi:hypothetical protein
MAKLLKNSLLPLPGSRFPTIALTAISSAILMTTIASAALAESYKTSRNQVVVTGLRRQSTYSIQTTNSRGRTGNRNITTNSCGEALISNGTAYRQITIEDQAIVPANLPTKTHPRCNPPRR